MNVSVSSKCLAKKGHKSKVSTGVDNHGDCVAARGFKRKGETVIGITQYGNGTVNTWDKDCNSQSRRRYPTTRRLQ